MASPYPACHFICFVPDCSLQIWMNPVSVHHPMFQEYVMEHVIDPPQAHPEDPITEEEARNPYYNDQMDWFGPSALAAEYLQNVVSSFCLIKELYMLLCGHCFVLSEIIYIIMIILLKRNRFYLLFLNEVFKITIENSEKALTVEMFAEKWHFCCGWGWRWIPSFFHGQTGGAGWLERPPHRTQGRRLLPTQKKKEGSGCQCLCVSYGLPHKGEYNCYGLSLNGAYNWFGLTYKVRTTVMDFHTKVSTTVTNFHTKVSRVTI